MSTDVEVTKDNEENVIKKSYIRHCSNLRENKKYTGHWNKITI